MTGYVRRGALPDISLCQCGCGEPAPVARKTDRRTGAVKGQPRRYVTGHNPGNDMAAARAALAAKRASGARVKDRKELT